MAKLTRVTGKVFGSQASPTGDVDNGAYIGQFGSAQAGTYVGTDDVAMIQNLPAWEQGWIGACVEEDQLPPLPERTGVDKVLSYQECYLLQQGMPEWDSATTYYIDNFCSYNGIIYKSLTDINLNNQPDTSVANWEVYGKISQYTKFAINKGNPDLLNAPGSGTVEQPFVQPTLTSNGTLGGSSFAVGSTGDINNRPQYYLFDNNSGTAFALRYRDDTKYPVTFYNPLPLKVTGLSFVVDQLGSITGYPTVIQIDVSDDNVVWNTLGTYNNTSATPSIISTFDLSDNTNYYNYYKITVLNGTVDSDTTQINITATERVSVSTADTLYFNVDNANPLTYTNIMGETRTVDSLLSIDVSAENDGTYKVALPQTGNQPYLFNGEIYIQDNESIPEFQKKFTDYNFYVENYYMKVDDGGIIAFPDGLNADGSKKFLYKTVSALSFTITTWASGNAMPCILDNGGVYGFYTYFQNQWYNQTTQPAVAGIWYNPETNIIKDSADGVTWTTQNVSLPIGITYFTNGTGFTSLVETYQTPQVLWINPQEPYTAQLTDKVIGYGNWQDFNDVLLLDSSVTVSSGVITALEQPKYNNSHITPNKSYISSLGMPSDKYKDLTLLSSGSTYVAPANGYFYLSKVTASTNQNIVLTNTTKNFLQDSQAYSSGIALNSTIMVEKNDIVDISYSASGTTNTFRFIYAEGEV